MAREQWHRWGQTVVTIITLVFVCGITYSNISHNTSDINRNTDKVERVVDKVHEIEINQAEKLAVDKAIASALTELKVGVASIKTEMGTIKTDVAVMKTKINTLTKD
jgi:hypothetical protein